MKKFQGIEALVTTREEKNALVVTISGKAFTEFSDLSLFQKKVIPLCKADIHCVFDLSQVSYINSRGLKEIIALHKDKQRKGQSLWVVDSQGIVKELLRAMSLQGEIFLASSLDVALQHIGGLG